MRLYGTVVLDGRADQAESAGAQIARAVAALVDAQRARSASRESKPVEPTAPPKEDGEPDADTPDPDQP